MPQKEPKNLFVILGPTAVGKSSLALSLAQKWSAEIVSVDAMQVYKYMDIGTAKPSALDQSVVPHHMIDIVYPNEDYNAGRYEEEASQVIEQIHRSGKMPLVVGGCGLYLKALLNGLFHGPKADPHIRQQLKEEAMKKGENYLYKKLKEIDPATAQKIHPHDQVRLLRAIEVYLQTGLPISVYQKEHSFRSRRYNAQIIGLTRDRNDLYNKIDQRVDEMIEKGLVEEVKKLLNMGYPENALAFQGLGYKQIIAGLKGTYTLKEAIDIIKRDTRHYAKRQFTWFGRLENVHWIELTSSPSFDEIIKEIHILTEKLFNKEKPTPRN